MRRLTAIWVMSLIQVKAVILAIQVIREIPVTWGKSVIQVMNSMGTKMNQRTLRNMVDYGNFNNCENINNQSKFCNMGNISD